jgi:hypothetical protein
MSPGLAVSGALWYQQGMADTTYEVFQEGPNYKVRITRLGSFDQEADGFVSREDAEAWIAQDQRIALLDKQRGPTTSAHLKVVRE